MIRARTTRAAASGRRARSRLVAGFVAGVAAVALLVGGGSAAAYWTASAAATGTAGSLKVAVTQDKVANLDKTYLNSTLLAKPGASLANAASFTVQNTGAATGTASATLTGTGALGPGLKTQAWVVAANAPCGTQVPAGVTPSTGTWASTVITVGSLAPNQTATVCVLTTATDRNTAQSSSGAASVTGSVRATIVSGGWTATAATAMTSTQQTDAVFPLARTAVPSSGSRWVMVTKQADAGKCLDIWDGSQDAGASTGMWDCFNKNATQPSANRVWQLIPDAADRSLVTVRPASAPDKRWGVRSDGTLEIQSVASTPGQGNYAAQRWYLQQRPAGYQLVSAVDGRCINTERGNFPITMSECNVAGVAFGLSAPVNPTIAGVAGTNSVVIKPGFYRYNINGAGYTARFVGSTATCTSIDTTNPPIQDSPVTEAQRTIICSVAAGTYTVELVAKTKSGGEELIHRFTATVTATGVSMGAVQ